MIVDFGGGTLDVSIVDCFENIIEITAIAGDNRLGGDDIDLGHSQPSTTLDIYTHAFDKKNKKAASEALQRGLDI